MHSYAKSPSSSCTRVSQAVRCHSIVCPRARLCFVLEKRNADDVERGIHLLCILSPQARTVTAKGGNNR